MAYYEKREGGWSVRWRDPDGTNRRRQVPDTRSRDNLIREIERATAEGRRWEPVAGRNPSVSELVDEYLREMKRVWRPNTYESHDVSLSLFQSWLEASSRRNHQGIELMSKTLVGEFWDYCREERGIGVNTANLRARSVEQFWKWCWEHDEHGAVTPRPKRLQLPSREQAATRAPTWAEMDRVTLAHTTERYRRLCWLMRCTGLRKNQVFGIKWDDIDFSDPDCVLLHLPGELGKTKGERLGRSIPLAPVLVQEIAGWGLRVGHLLQWNTGARKAHNITLEGAWERAGVDEAKWRGRTAHAFRKGFVTELIGAGAHREAVEYLVGHSMGLRGVYTDPRALPIRQAVALVPPLLPSVQMASTHQVDSIESRRGARK